MTTPNINTTLGQMLYEHEHPTHIRVVPVGQVAFATVDDVILVPNPMHQAPWRLLTERCRQEYERRAVGHNFFSPEPK